VTRLSCAAREQQKNFQLTASDARMQIRERVGRTMVTCWVARLIVRFGEVLYRRYRMVGGGWLRCLGK
jgi:hypothetical protein